MDEDTTKEDMISCCKTLGSAKTKYGVYYVFGFQTGKSSLRQAASQNML